MRQQIRAYEPADWPAVWALLAPVFRAGPWRPGWGAAWRGLAGAHHRRAADQPSGLCPLAQERQPVVLRSSNGEQNGEGVRVQRTRSESPGRVGTVTPVLIPSSIPPFTGCNRSNGFELQNRNFLSAATALGPSAVAPNPSSNQGFHGDPPAMPLGMVESRFEGQALKPMDRSLGDRSSHPPSRVLEDSQPQPVDGSSHSRDPWPAAQSTDAQS